MNKEKSTTKSYYSVIRENLVLLAIVALVLITIVVEPKFLTAANLTNIIRQFGPLSMVALGMTFVILAGFIDLSVVGMFSLVSIITVSLIEPLGQVGALLVGLASGAAMGYLNSKVILSCGALKQSEALFITYGMTMIYGAAALILSGGSTLHLKRVEKSISMYEFIGQGGFGLLSVSFIIFLICLLVLYIFQSKTYFGRTIFLTGGNKEASRLAGISVNRSMSIVFTISGLMTAMGAVMLFSRVTTASPVIGKNYDTNAILAVVVGGTTLKGGKGSVLRTVLGVALVTLLSNCMNLLGVSTYMQSVLKGAILVLAICLDNN